MAEPDPERDVPASDGPSGADAPRRRSSRGTKSGGSFLRELPVLLVIAFVLAFLLRTFVLQVFYIPSASMEPTLMVDDRMVVEKITTLYRDPERGEIWVFEGEEGFTTPSNGVVDGVVRGIGQFLGLVPTSARDFVKRVVGLPGDEIVIDEGQLLINGTALDEPYAVEEITDYGPVTVPEGRLFFLGDNRPNSSDSRRSLGFVEIDNLVGRAVVTIFPISEAGLLTGVAHEVAEPDGPVPDPEDVDLDDVERDAA